MDSDIGWKDGSIQISTKEVSLIKGGKVYSLSILGRNVSDNYVNISETIETEKSQIICNISNGGIEIQDIKV
jgi:hypothetical protein